MKVKELHACMSITMPLAIILLSSVHSAPYLNTRRVMMVNASAKMDKHTPAMERMLRVFATGGSKPSVEVMGRLVSTRQAKLARRLQAQVASPFSKEASAHPSSIQLPCPSGNIRL